MKISIVLTKDEMIEAIKVWLEYNNKRIDGDKVEFHCAGAINGECNTYRIQYQDSGTKKGQD